MRAPTKALLATVLLVALALGAAASTGPGLAVGAEVLAPPAPGLVYHAANPGFGPTEDRVSAARIRRFERLAGKPIAWAYFSNNWTHGVDYPARRVATIEAAGRVPFIRIEPRSSFRAGGPDRRYTMQSIIDGAWDLPTAGSQGLIEWCRRAARADGPLLVEFGTEVNGSWFPWNGRWNGGEATAGYGDPMLADGPERFRDAYRHVVDTCRDAGADNITWFFHVDVEGAPGTAWNRLSAYYPGDDYVDWIGLSAYGSLSARYDWRSFGARLRPVRDEIVALGDKPVALLETGVREDAASRGRKAAWTQRMLRAVRTRFPEIRAVAWWNERYRDRGELIDLRIDSSRSALRAYRRGVAARAFTGDARFAPR